MPHGDVQGDAVHPHRQVFGDPDNATVENRFYDLDKFTATVSFQAWESRLTASLGTKPGDGPDSQGGDQ